jgi:hypothetical protein
MKFYSLNERTNVLCNFLNRNCENVQKSQFNSFEYWVDKVGDFVVIHKKEIEKYLNYTIKHIALSGDWRYEVKDLKVVFEKSEIDKAKYEKFMLSKNKTIGGGAIRDLIEKTIGLDAFMGLLLKVYTRKNKMEKVIAQQNDVDVVSEFVFGEYYIYRICEFAESC